MSRSDVAESAARQHYQLLKGKLSSSADPVEVPSAALKTLIVFVTQAKKGETFAALQALLAADPTASTVLVPRATVHSFLMQVAGALGRRRSLGRPPTATSSGEGMVPAEVGEASGGASERERVERGTETADTGDALPLAEADLQFSVPVSDVSRSLSLAESVRRGVAIRCEHLAEETLTSAKLDAYEEEPVADSADGTTDNAEPAEPEPSKTAGERQELEEEAHEDARLRVVSVGLSESDSTLNLLATDGGLVTSLGDGGFQYLLAGARATVGVKSGRYMFEVKIVEMRNVDQPQGAKVRAPIPQNLLRIGLSLAGSSLFLADSSDYVCFDSEGSFAQGRSRLKVGPTLAPGVTVALLLNLDAASPNVNTVSLFHDGVRVSAPQKLPENMLDKPLFPTLAFRSMTLQLNFGANPLVPLPFSCRMLQDAAAADLQVETSPAEEHYEVVFPIGKPDTGVFDWADHFVEKNPAYTELSDRKLLEWAAASGLRPKNPASNNLGSTDKPENSLGLSLNEVLSLVVPALKRNFVVMELQANLLAEARSRAISRFSAPHFKKTAVVIMGDPSEEHKEHVQSLILADKVVKAENDKRKKLADLQRKRLLEESRRKSEDAKRARKGEGQGDAEGVKEVERVEEGPSEDPPVTLTDEEKLLTVRPLDTADLTQSALAKSFTMFSLPSTDEGFDSIRYEWQPMETCQEELVKHIRQLKLITRVDVQPSQWFKDEASQRQRLVNEWQKLHNEWKIPAKRKAVLEKKKEEGTNTEINVTDLDINTVEDVTDIGNGEPLFSNFTFEDWTLLRLRMEFQLLLVAFRKDVDDPERVSFHESQLNFYYSRYFKKNLNLRIFGCEKFETLVALICDTIALSKERLLESKLEDPSMVHFVKLTEEHRRDRQRRLDAGDETAELKFSKPAPPTRPAQPTSQAGHKRPHQDGGSITPKRADHGGKRGWTSRSGNGESRGGNANGSRR